MRMLRCYWPRMKRSNIYFFLSNFWHYNILKKDETLPEECENLKLKYIQLSLKHFHRTEFYQSGNDLTLALRVMLVANFSFECDATG